MPSKASHSGETSLLSIDRRCWKSLQEIFSARGNLGSGRVPVPRASKDFLAASARQAYRRGFVGRLQQPGHEIYQGHLLRQGDRMLTVDVDHVHGPADQYFSEILRGDVLGQ